MRMPKNIALAAAAALAAFGLAAAPAVAQAGTSGVRPRVQVINLHKAYEAHVGHTRHAPVAGIVYARGKQPKAANTRESCSEPNCPLVDNGGSVQHSPHVYLLFWGPTWSTDSGEQASMSYLENLCNGLGVQPQDTWSTITDQYTDSTGHPSFSGTVCEGFFQDTSPPPTGVDQSQLAAEADAFTSSQGITDTTDAQIVIATQSGICPQGFYAPGCDGGSGYYCAWHSYSNEPYTNLPYVLDAGAGCGEDFVNPSGTHDGFSIVEGHEYAETITDPFPDSGWWDPGDSSGGEIGDKCAWSSLSRDVALSTGSFAMQPLYSNNAFSNNKTGCVMKATGTVTVTNPGRQSSYQNSRLNLQMSGSSSGGYSLAWSASGLPAGLTINSTTGLISGQVTAPASTYSVTVTATDSNGASGSASFNWVVKADTGSLVKNSASAKCLNDHGWWTTPGNPIVIWTCFTGAGNERFSHPRNPGELVVFGQCLTDPASGGGGTRQVIEPCTGASNQMWYHNSKYEYVLQANGLCLTDPGGSKLNGTQIAVSICKNVSNQHWHGS